MHNGMLLLAAKVIGSLVPLRVVVMVMHGWHCDNLKHNELIFTKK